MTDRANDTTSQSKLDAALDAVSLGLYVLPLWGVTDGACGCGNPACERVGKHPHRLARHGSLDATNEPAKVSELWGIDPHANVGIALEPSGLCIVGPDSPEWAARFDELGLPPTVVVQSGGGEGHQHFWYSLPDDWPRYRLCKTGEYDIITNGYGVIPPSMHKSGRAYSFIVPPQGLGITHFSQLPEAPGWVLQMLQEAAERLEDEPDDPNEPLVALDPLGLEYWHGDRKALKPDGSIDRSETMYAIGTHMAKAGASKALIAKALAERDAALGYRCYSDRRDAARRYREIAAKVTGHGNNANTANNANGYFPGSILPEPIASYVTAVCEAAGDPPMPAEYVALPILAITGGLIGRQAELEVKAGWRERAQEWFANVGKPGSGKTPGQRAAVALIERAQSLKMEEYKALLQEWRASLQPGRPATPKPLPEQYYVSDATFEALASVLEGAPGITMVRDELLAWVLSFDAYRAGGDRQRWLEAWAGASLVVNRKTADPVYIRDPVISVVGGIQPDRLPDLRAEAGQQDGFIDRVLFGWPADWSQGWSETELEPAITHAAQAHMLKLRDDVWQGANTLVVRPTPEARQRFARWYNHNAQHGRNLTGLAAGFNAKAPGHCARLALLLHCLWQPEHISRPLDVDTVERAILLTEYFREQGQRVYERIGQPITGAAALGLGARVLKALNHETTQENAGWVSRSVLYSKLRNVKPAELDKVLGLLESEGLIERRLVSTATKAREEWRAT